MATTAVLTRRVRKRIPANDVPPRIIVRGNLLTYKSGKAYSPPPAAAKREEISRFTREARLRQLKFTATVDYTSIRMSSFLTVTYPPECEHVIHTIRTRQREELMRKLENYNRGQIGGMWRTEWEERMSGPTKGNIAPHIHLLLFKVKYIPRGLIVEWWKRIIGCKDDPVVHIKRAVGKKGALLYIAKYIGKQEATCLVNASYLRKPDGRHWGYMRPERIPRWPEQTIECPTQEQIDFVYHVCQWAFPQGDIQPGESFTLFGEFIAEAMKIILEKNLTPDGEIS